MPSCCCGGNSGHTNGQPSPGDARKAVPNAVLDELIESISQNSIMVCVLERTPLQDVAEFSVPAAGRIRSDAHVVTCRY